MATSDTVIADITQSVAALGATEEYLTLFKTAIYDLMLLNMVEHQTAVEAAESRFKH